MLDTRVPMWRTQPMQQQKTQATPPATPPTATPGDQPPATGGPNDPADPPLGAPGLRALQAERDTVARLTAELAAAKAPKNDPAPTPPATDDVTGQLSQLRKDLETERSARALSDAGVEHGLTKADLVIVGDFGTPEQIAARAKALKERLTASGATPLAPPAPGLPGLPNADQTGGTGSSVQTGFDAYAARKAKRTGVIPSTA